ncbi:MaoC family dehydratase [Nocardioides sp. Soil796]|uniref:MaoC family dehydratase n=1 Tax=Nocardioides sp. Soil796 TaxID=1736412 RepID=UPI000710B4CC|nr:MaoC family dehydratase [Nocardioides sp. Soil796]KRF10382.1 dehydratase [Nocardioides sp. Soil796]
MTGSVAAGPRVFNGLDELEAAVGSQLGHSEWHVVTQEQIDLFARATGDNQWIHTDPARAAEGPFGTTIAHGYLTLSLVPSFAWQIYEVRDITMGVNYGSNKVRFPAVVPVNSRVRGSAELVSVERDGNRATVTVRMTVERDGGDRPVCVAETVSVLVG